MTWLIGYIRATKVLAVLPQRGKDWLYKRMVPNQILAGDPSARAEYEARRLS